MKISIAILLLLVACANDDVVDQKACSRLRDHVIDLRLREVDADRERHREAMRRTLGDNYVARCVEVVTRSQLDCSMAARDVSALQACSTSASAR
jgi:hypothetical protein